MVNGRGSGEPPSKRTRVSRACDQCRSNREKCNGSRPQCSTCSTQERHCSYDEQPKKRGIQPNYIRTLELALAWTFRNFPDIESSLSKELPTENSTAQGLIGGKDAAASEELHLAWRRCLVNQQLDQLLSRAAIDTDGVFIGNGNGPEQDASTSMQPGAMFQSLIDPTPVEKPTTQSVQLTTRDYGLQNNFDGPRRLDLPENAWHLLEWYWAFTFSWSPMLDKASVMKLMYSYPIEDLNGDIVISGEHAELWSIMALAASQILDDQKQDEARQIRRTAESLMPAGDNASFKVPHIRAMILLTLLDAQAGRMLAAWLRIGTVVSLLLLFKLIETLDVHTRFCRNVHLVAFVVESALASYMNAPTHFTNEYINSVGFVSEDFREEWEPWSDPSQTLNTAGGMKKPTRAFSTLNNLVRLCMRSGGDMLERPGANASADQSVVFSLLKNASERGQRTQPSTLITTYHSVHPSHSSSIQPPLSSPTAVYGDAELGPIVPNATNAALGSTEIHRFMSIPSESSTFPISDVTGRSGLSVLDAPLRMTSGTQYDGTAENDSRGTGALGDGSNIFDEFDAMLERQDSNFQPQFMQNLGFQPDSDLIDFFGSDWQTSNPVFSYDNTATYNGS